MMGSDLVVCVVEVLAVLGPGINFRVSSILTSQAISYTIGENQNELRLLIICISAIVAQSTMRVE